MAKAEISRLSELPAIPKTYKTSSLSAERAPRTQFICCCAMTTISRCFSTWLTFWGPRETVSHIIELKILVVGATKERILTNQIESNSFAVLSFSLWFSFHYFTHRNISLCLCIGLQVFNPLSYSNSPWFNLLFLI